MTFSAAEVVRHYAALQNDEHRQICEITQQALEGMELVFRHEQPLDFDPLLGRQLDERFGRQPYATVYPLADLWFLKRGCVSRVDENSAGVKGKMETYYHRYNNLFRVVANAWFNEMNEREGYQVIVPKEYLVPLPNWQELPPDLGNLVASEKEDCYDRDETVEEIEKMPLRTQCNLIDYLCGWVSKSGCPDCNFANIRLSIKKKMPLYNEQVPQFVITDTEPFGLITETNDTPRETLLAPGITRERLTLDEAAYIGLSSLHNELQGREFSPEVQAISAHWVESVKDKISFEPPKGPPAPTKKRWRPWKRRSKEPLPEAFF